MKTKLKKWTKVSSRPILKNNYFWITHDRVRLPDGRLYDYYLSNEGQRAATILPVDTRGRILVTKEYRYPVKKVIYNSIGGSIETHEKPIAAARRELIEETGYRARKFTFLGNFYGNPSRSGVLFYAYLATGLIPGPARPEPMELLESEWLTPSKFERLARTGEIREPFLMSAYLLYKIGARH